MSKHCPDCDAYPLAVFRNGDLVSVAIRHTDRCMPRLDPIDPATWRPNYNPASRSTLGERPTRAERNLERKGMFTRPSRAQTADGRQRRR